MRSNSFAAASVDREPAEVEVGDLDHGVGGVDDLGEELALGDRLVDAPLERLVEHRAGPARRGSGRSSSVTRRTCGERGRHRRAAANTRR
jgi:hypothetical protein